MRRDRREVPEQARLFSTMRRILGRPKRPSAGRRAALLATLRFALLLPFLLVVLTLAAWWFGAKRAALTEPGETFQLQSTSFTLSPGKSVKIGRAHLMQRPARDSAEPDHVRFELMKNGDVRLANVAKERRLSLLRDGQEINAASADRIELTGPPGQTTRVTIDGRNVIFRNVSVQGFEIEIEGNGRFQTTIGLGWSEVRRIGGDGSGLAQDVCAAPGWRDHVQTSLTWLSLLLNRPLNQAVIYLGGRDTCQVGRAFALAVPRSEGIDELVVTMTTEDKFGRERRLFLAPLGGRTRNLVTIERYRTGCAVGDRRCRSAVQSGFSGTSWLIASPPPRSRDPAARDPTPGAATWSEMRVWRFVAGRTTYAIEVAFAAEPSRDSEATITLRPSSVIHQFSRRDCAWFITADGAPPPQPSEDENAICPERPQARDPAVRVTPTSDGQLMFDRQLATRPLEAYERASRLAILVLAVTVALILAAPGSSGGRGWHGSTAWIRRILGIWPVLVSVAVAASPDLFMYLNLRVSAVTAFALTIGNWTFAGIVLGFVSRTGRQLALMWVALMGLAAVGAISLATLAGDVGTTRAATYLVKHKLVFLDLLPPIALAVVTARLNVLRPLLASVVLDNRKRYAIVRWLPIIAMIGLFAFWLAIGTQQGLGGLQPVEGGKFCFVIIVGAVLVSLERASRAETLATTRWSRIMAVAIVIVFMLAIYAVPFLRNDYSPLLIISTTGLVLVVIRFLPDVWRWMVARFRVLSERMHLPMRLRPRVYEPFIPFLITRVPRGAKFLAGIGLSVGGLVAATLVFVFFGGALVALALNLEQPDWPAKRDDQMKLLENSLGIGRRVPIERFLTWIDLDYDAAGPPRANYRDVGFQVIRSRVEIENANCEMSEEMRGGPIMPGLTKLPNRAVENLALNAARLFGFDLASTSPLCVGRASSEAVDSPSAALLVARGAHTIPVAESDFAAAYLIARHGVASGVLLFAFQFAFFVLAIWAYMRLTRLRDGDTSEVIVRYLLSTLLAGTTSLFVIQWFLAWSNSLGLFPVMGQPMTWLSAGTSHHLLLALPCAVTILLAIRYTVATRTRRSLRSPPL